MLFGVDFCGRRPYKRRKRSGGALTCLLIICLAAVITGLLFLAPQWLLVLLVIALTGAVIALVCIPRC